MLIIRLSGKIGRELGCDSGNGEPLQVSWNRQFRNNLCVFIPKSMGFSQPKLWLPVSTSMRIPEKYRKCRYANMSQKIQGLQKYRFVGYLHKLNTLNRWFL
jgi:hypothetical protein